MKGYIRSVVIDGAAGALSLTRPKRCNGSPSCLFCLSLEYCTTKPSGCMDPKHWMNSAWTDHSRQNAPWKFWLVTTKFYFFMLLIIQWANEWVTNLGRELLSQLENDPPKLTNRKNSNLTTLEWFFLELLRTEGELGWACWWRCPHWGTRHTPFFCRCVQWIEEEPGKCQYFCIFLLDTKGWDILSCYFLWAEWWKRSNLIGLPSSHQNLLVHLQMNIIYDLKIVCWSRSIHPPTGTNLN